MRCSSCQTIFPFDGKHFTKDKTRRFGFKPLCVKRNRQSCAEYRFRNLEASREKDRQRYISNSARRDSAKSRAETRYANNREQIIEYVAQRAKARQNAGLPRIINEEKRESAKEKIAFAVEVITVRTLRKAALTNEAAFVLQKTVRNVKSGNKIIREKLELLLLKEKVC